jgi:flagellar hook-basal body complex protein FliE
MSMNPIQNISTPLTLSSSVLAGKDAAQGADSFKNYLLDSIQQVNEMQQQADSAVEKFATGGDVSPAEVLTAVQKADLAFKMMLQVRNKLVQAYQDVEAIRV